MESRLLSSVERRSRRRRWCQTCGGVIRQGQRYLDEVLVDCDRVGRWRTCLPCQDDQIWSHVSAWAGWDEGLAGDDCYQWAAEMATDSSASDDAVSAARRYLARRAQPDDG